MAMRTARKEASLSISATQPQPLYCPYFLFADAHRCAFSPNNYSAVAMSSLPSSPYSPYSSAVWLNVAGDDDPWGGGTKVSRRVQKRRERAARDVSGVSSDCIVVYGFFDAGIKPSALRCSTQRPDAEMFFKHGFTLHGE